MRAAAMASNIIELLPGLSHGALHPQITSCGPLSLPIRTLQRVSMAERKESLLPNVVRASSTPDYNDPGSGSGRSIVDASMPFLRKRINKLKQKEDRKSPRFAPEEELDSEWMEWEKEVYPLYHSKICQSIGLLHYYLIYTRPSVALASFSVIAVVMAASAILLLVTIVNSIHLARFGAWF